MEQSRTGSAGRKGMLLLTALIWGVAFVAQSEGMNYVGGFTFNCCRFLIGGAVLIPCIFFLRRLGGDQRSGEDPQDPGRTGNAGNVGNAGKTEKEQRRMAVLGGKIGRAHV